MRILHSHRIQSHDQQGMQIEALAAALRAAGHEACVVGPPAHDAVPLGGESPALARIRRLLPGAMRELAEIAYGLVSTARQAHAARTFRPDIACERANLVHVAGSCTARWRGAGEDSATGFHGGWQCPPRRRPGRTRARRTRGGATDVRRTVLESCSHRRNRTAAFARGAGRASAPGRAAR